MTQIQNNPSSQAALGLGLLAIRNYPDRLLVFGFLLPEAKKAPGRKASKHTPGLNSGSKKNTPSIIRATCAFDSKKVHNFRFGILVT